MKHIGAITEVTTISGSTGKFSTSLTISGVPVTINGLQSLVEDLTPQLGGNLDAQTFNISSVGTLQATTITGTTGQFGGNLSTNALVAVTGTFSAGITIGSSTTHIYPNEIRTPLLTAQNVNTTGLVVSPTGTFSTSLTVSGLPVSLGVTPGGSNAQVQYNSGGTFAGDPQFTFNIATDTLSVDHAACVTVSGTTGAFAGTLSAQTGTFSNSLTISGMAVATAPAVALDIEEIRRFIYADLQGGDSRVSTVSLDFATNEYLANTTDAGIGISNDWTVLVWFKKPAAYTDTNHRILTFEETTGDENRIGIDLEDTSPAGIAVNLYDSAGAQFKGYRYLAAAPVDTWTAILFTWYGSGPTLQGYFNGVATAADVTSPNTGGTITNTPRQVWFGAVPGGSAYLTGKIHSVTVWNVSLPGPAAIAASVPRHNPFSSAYGYRANVMHWWRFGLPAINGMAGTTYVCDAVVTAGVNVSANAANISDADIVSDAPA